MKICFITTGNIKNIATSKRALGMANPLSELGFEVHILMENAIENKERVALQCNKEVNIHYFPKVGMWQEVKLKNKILKSIQPDYIYLCAFIFRNIVLPFNNKIIKLVEHSELQSGIPDVKGIKRLWSVFMEYYSLIYADGLLCASKYLENFFLPIKKRFALKGQIFYHPYAYSQALYSPKSNDELSATFSKLLDKKNFVFLGTITKNYGALTMVEAFKKLREKRSDIRLLMLGRGRHYEDVVSYVKENNLEDDVNLPGYISEADIPNYLSVAHSFILPLNNTIQDLARCPSKLFIYLPFEKPIITCELGEPLETLGETGLYYKAGDVEDLQQQLEKSLINQNYNLLSPVNHTWEARTQEFHVWLSQSLLK